MSLESRLAALVLAIGTDIKTLFSDKQATLVSGTNIKTVNGNSLLGAGNLTIAGGGGGSGDVVGPASSEDNLLAQFDGTTGKLIKQAKSVSGDWVGKTFVTRGGLGYSLFHDNSNDSTGQSGTFAIGLEGNQFNSPRSSTMNLGLVYGNGDSQFAVNLMPDGYSSLTLNGSFYGPPDYTSFLRFSNVTETTSPMRGGSISFNDVFTIAGDTSGEGLDSATRILGFRATGEIMVGPNQQIGSLGQALTSGGEGGAPSWSDVIQPNALGTDYAEVTVGTFATSGNVQAAPVYGNGLWVSVWGGTEHKIFTSPDGMTWTERANPAPATGQFKHVAFGNGVFVAIGALVPGDTIFAISSSDGINWSNVTLTGLPIPAASFLVGGLGLKYTGSYFFLTGANNLNDLETYLLSSTDGVSWTQRIFRNDGLLWYDVAYGNQKYVAVTPNEPLVTTSIDGINWSAPVAPMEATGGLLGTSLGLIVFGNGLFVAANFSELYYSTDGLKWTIANSTKPANGFYAPWGFAFSAGTFVFSTYRGPYKSFDGKNWFQTLSRDKVTLGSIPVGSSNGVFLFLREAVLGTTAMAYVSTAETARSVPLISGGTVKTVNGVDVTGGGNAFTLYRDIGDYWVGTGAPKHPSDNFNNEDGYVAFAQSSTPYRRVVLRNKAPHIYASFTNENSPNYFGTLTPATLPDSRYTGVAIGNSMVVVVASNLGGSPRIVTSGVSDMETWTTQTSPGGVADSFDAVAFGGGLFVAVGSGATKIATSTDGITWTARTNPAGQASDVAYLGGVWVAWGDFDDSLITSPDGITWTDRSANLWGSTPPVTQIYGLTYVPKTGTYYFLGVDDNETHHAYTSADVTGTWTGVQTQGAYFPARLIHTGNYFLSMSDSQLIYSFDAVNWSAFLSDLPPRSLYLPNQFIVDSDTGYLWFIAGDTVYLSTDEYSLRRELSQKRHIKTIQGQSALGDGDLSVITISATAPVSPTLNQLWLDTSA